MGSTFLSAKHTRSKANEKKKSKREPLNDPMNIDDPTGNPTDDPMDISNDPTGLLTPETKQDPNNQDADAFDMLPGASTPLEAMETLSNDQVQINQSRVEIVSPKQSPIMIKSEPRSPRIEARIPPYNPAQNLGTADEPKPTKTALPAQQSTRTSARLANNRSNAKYSRAGK